MKSLSTVFKNKVFLYVGSRYLTYGLQFISLIILADKLGPYNYGIWGFIVMIIGYLNIINFGIPNSVNVYIVQNKSKLNTKKEYISSAFLIDSILICILILLGIVYHYDGNILFKKYNIGSWFYFILLIGAFQYLNNLMMNVFRAENKLFEVAFYQSSIPIIIFSISIIFTSESLIKYLIYGYVTANIISFILFIVRGNSYIGGQPSIKLAKLILNKGFYLFIYNSCFYLILITTSTLVSWHYSVTQYGVYSLSYTIGHSILLLLEAFTFVIFPKIIDIFYSGDNEIAVKTIQAVRINYIVLSHGLMYVALICFPVFIYVFPNFNNSVVTLNMIMLAIILTTNAFGYNTLLIARNKEKIIAIISSVSLILNCIIGILMIKVIHIQYYNIVFSIIFSYLTFAYLCSWHAHKILRIKLSLNEFIQSIMPISLLLPYLLALFIVLLNLMYLISLPLMLFIIMNKASLKDIYKTIKTIIVKPQIIDIN